MIHAIALIVDSEGQPARKLDKAQALAAAYELASEAVDEFVLATDLSRAHARSIMVRAHIINHFRQSDPRDVLEFVRGLISELTPASNEPPSDDAQIT